LITGAGAVKKAVGLFFSLSGFRRKVERYELVVRKYSPNGGSLAGVAGRQLSINTGRVLADRRGRGSSWHGIHTCS